MQLEELNSLTTWATNEITAKKLPTKLAALVEILNHNASANQQKKPFETQKESVLSTLNAMELSALSIGQMQALERHGVLPNIAQAGAAKVEDVLFRNAIDVATAAQKVTEMQQSIEAFVTWCDQLKKLLAKISTVQTDKDEKDYALLRVHFTGDASISNIVQLKEWSAAWHDIGRGIAMAHGSAPEDVRVVSASRGSIIVSLLVAYGITKTISAILLEGLKVSESYLKARKLAEEVRSLQIGNDRAALTLLEDAAKHRESAVQVIVDKTVSDLGIRPESEGDKVAALQSAIKKLIGFSEKGGEVDFVVSEPAKDEPDERRQTKAELKSLFQQVRQAEESIKQLEHKKP